MSDQYCPISCHTFIPFNKIIYCEKCGLQYLMETEKQETILESSPSPRNIVFSMENIGAKQISGEFVGKNCLHGDDSNTHHSYAIFPSFLKFQFSEAQIVNHFAGFLYDADGRSHSMLFEASLDDINWDILYQASQPTLKGKFGEFFKPKKYKYFRFSGRNTTNDYFVLNSLYIQYKE
jgi:hypothetical protein